MEAHAAVLVGAAVDAITLSADVVTLSARASTSLERASLSATRTGGCNLLKRGYDTERESATHQSLSATRRDHQEKNASPLDNWMLEHTLLLRKCSSATSLSECDSSVCEYDITERVRHH